MKPTLFIVSAITAIHIAANAAEPIVSADWFPLVNGAIYDYKNDAVVSSTAARVTVMGGQTFNGVSGLTKWNMVVACDATAGKTDWGGEPSIGRAAKSAGGCLNYARYLTQISSGMVMIGDRREFTEYGYLVNSPKYSRESVYTGSRNTIIVKDGAVPGDYVFTPLPIPIGSYVLQGQTGTLWQNNATGTVTYVGLARAPNTASTVESFREVGVYAAFNTYVGDIRTLFIEDAILDAATGYAPSQRRYQAWHYAKGLGPVVLKGGDFRLAASGAGFVPNAPDGQAMYETFVLTRHNLYGCPGYDPTLPPLPANSGNVCSKFYAAPVSIKKTMTEYYYAPLDYYFITSRDGDKTLLDATTGFARTGKSFNVLVAADPGSAGLSRFYFDKVAKAGTRGSHFYTLLESDKAALRSLNPTNAQTPKSPYDEGVDSYAFPPAVAGVGGSCVTGLVPVYRLFRGSARFPDDPNHRFTTELAVYNEFVAKGWDGEGVNFCTPQ